MIQVWPAYRHPHDTNVCQLFRFDSIDICNAILLNYALFLGNILCCVVFLLFYLWSMENALTMGLIMGISIIFSERNFTAHLKRRCTITLRFFYNFVFLKPFLLTNMGNDNFRFFFNFSNRNSYWPIFGLQFFPELTSWIFTFISLLRQLTSKMKTLPKQYLCKRNSEKKILGWRI